jgi:fission process protein 1
MESEFDANKVREYARPLAYTSEVGEAFRPLIYRSIVNTAYGISIGYVIGDTAFHIMKLRQKLQTDPKFDKLDQNEQTKLIAINGIDKAVWHSFASMVLPALSVHTIVKYSGKSYLFGMNKLFPHILNAVKFTRVGSVATGLLAIPFIIHPLDHATDFVMDRTLRTVYSDKLILD